MEPLEIVVHCLIWDDKERLLLLERSSTGVMDGRFAPPGGHVQDEELISDAALREVREEVGLAVQQLETTGVLPFKGGMNFIFSTLDWKGEPRNCEPDKCSEVSWFSVDDLPPNVVPWLATALKLRQKVS